MKKPSDKNKAEQDLRTNIMGMGEKSVHKSYYPELQEKMAELERYQALLDQADDAICLLELPGLTLLQSNKKAKQFFQSEGGTKKTLEGEVGKETIRCIQNWLATSRGEASSHLQIETVPVDAKAPALGITVSRVNFKAVDFLVLVARDITARKRGEERIRSMNLELERRVAQRTLELQEANRHLQEAMNTAVAANQAKSRFLANMSHEIRTPMNSVIGLAHLTLETELTQQQREYLGIIKNSAETLLGVLNDILDFSKIEAGKMQMEKIAFTIEEVLHNLSTVTASQAEEKGVELLIRVENDVPSKLMGDPLRLGQILINLVNNAVKYTERGEVIIEISKAETEAERTKLRFTISDTGIGMTEDQVERIFQPFDQADTSMTRRFGGTGLGLSICKGLVEQMGGELQVESTLHRGSAFSFSIWYDREVKGGLEPNTIPYFPGLKALVVDDNEAARELYSSMLQELHMDVHTAGSGEACLTAVLDNAESRPYDLILMDYKMPEMNGLEAIEALKSLSGKTARRTRILIVTGYGHSALRKRALSLGADGYLEKPVSFYQLSAVLSRLYTLEESPSPDTAEPSWADRMDLKGAKVLLVEDNDINQLVANKLLTGVGIEVTIVKNGAVAVETIEKAETVFDAVLMDIQMPVMDGYEATRRIRKNRKFSHLPIIGLTAHAMRSEYQRCLDAGMNTQVTKPINPKQLFDALAEEIGKAP